MGRSVVLAFMLAGATLAMQVTSFTNVQAQQPMVQLGVLECRGGASIGFSVGCVTNLGCVLRVYRMREDPYGAAMRHGGAGRCLTQETALARGLGASLDRRSRGDL